MKKKAAFSMIELLFVMAILGILTSIAVPNILDKIKLDLHEQVEADMVGYSNLTNKIIASDTYAPEIDYTATATGDAYVYTSEDNIDFRFVLAYKGFNLQEFQINDSSTGDYTDYGIIINANDMFGDKSCYVFNHFTDSAPYWSNLCTADDLGWDYQ